MRKLLYQGSVKNLYQIDNQIEFEFTDQYSIFDWGVMPDMIPGKGKALAQLTTFFFEKLQNPHTFNKLTRPESIGQKVWENLINSNTLSTLKVHGALTHFKAYKEPSSILVDQVKIEHPSKNAEGKYDYSSYQQNLENTLIPLEVVWRLGAPAGSSLLKREKHIYPNQKFADIRIEFYTKLEPQDRLLTNDEAIAMAGLKEAELKELEELTKIFAITLENTFAQAGFTLWDGKFEFAFGKTQEGNREIILVDSIGPDELRLTDHDLSFSKEYLRSCYHHTKWYQELSQNKKTYKDDFKVQTKSTPQRLTANQLAIASEIYTSIYNSLINKKLSLGSSMQEHLNHQGKNIVVFGKGGREHALAFHLAKSEDVKQVFVIPGNSGMQSDKIKSLSVDDDKYISFCKDNHIAYAIIGPEDLIEAGLADDLLAAGIACVSPNQKAGKLESSKAFAKDLMAKNNIPTASYQNFNNTQVALTYIEQNDEKPYVVKLSGLAAGKGVIICQNKAQTQTAIKELAPNNEELVIEEFLEGKEVSFFALCLENEYQLLGTACDYKRLKDNDEGPNTGGMGCYSPAYWLKETELKTIESDILLPTLKALKSEGINFKGTLFIGLMMTNNGAKVLEYNVRFGDPETQTILPRLKSNLHPVFMAMGQDDSNSFKKQTIEYYDQASVHIVKAAKGYPGTGGMVVEKGQKITTAVKNSDNTQLFFAGIKSEEHHFVTNGGRVLGLTNLGKDIPEARKLAYKNIELVHFQGEQYRKDIGL